MGGGEKEIISSDKDVSRYINQYKDDADLENDDKYTILTIP